MRSSPHLSCVVLSIAIMASTALSSAAYAMTCEYDELGRLTKVTYDNGSYVVYQYDADGNRTVVTATRL